MVSDLINQAFNVDLKNSSNKDTSLLVDQMGYRSSHFVCDLGPQRKDLPEYDGLAGLKFEFQVRTVLQHAWAELAHDRNYKFSGKLPPAAERKLFLYAGMLELADRGFDELSSEIDSYIRDVQREVVAGDLEMEINSINLGEFIDEWARVNKFPLEHLALRDGLGDLVEELRMFGVSTLSDLNEIIPDDYAKRSIDTGISTTIYGLVRDWMLISDWQHYIDKVSLRWALSPNDGLLVQSYLPKEEHGDFESTFRDDSDWYDD